MDTRANENIYDQPKPLFSGNEKSHRASLMILWGGSGQVSSRACSIKERMNSFWVIFRPCRWDSVAMWAFSFSKSSSEI